MAAATLEKSRQYLLNTVSRLKKGIHKESARKNYDNTLSLISACAKVLYTANQCYADAELESVLCQTAQSILPQPPKEEVWDKNRILFYDGFGLNNRGLIQIYLKALCKIGYVIYVTDISHKDMLPDVLSILVQAGAQIVWTEREKPVAMMGKLYDIFQQYKPGSAFLYTTPEDVVSTTVFYRLAGSTTRFRINLTDHAYWLGTCASDYCLEFRDYGAVVSETGRHIPEDKLIKLPFYPCVDRTQIFQGYPFAFDPQRQKVIFSGGGLYKTLGGENRYYKLVTHILHEHPEAVFWYAGLGDRTEMDKLIAAFPGRVYLTEERRDLLQVLEHSFFYLSTYPITGGLMFQYAASAGKIPVTLKFDSEADGYLLDQKELGIEAETMEEAMTLINRIFTDEEFRHNMETTVSRAVISETEFERQLRQILLTHKSDYQISPYPVDVRGLQKEYLAAFCFRLVVRELTGKQYAAIAPYLPGEFVMSTLRRLQYKLFS